MLYYAQHRCLILRSLLVILNWLMNTNISLTTPAASAKVSSEFFRLSATLICF
jgi:hypothetical protein